MLAYCERKWGLEPMTARDAAANDMFDLFDLSRPHFEPPLLLPRPKLASDVLTCLKAGQIGYQPGVP
jgi:phospholipase C